MRPNKADQLDDLKRLLHELFTARAEGERYPKLARTHGYVDGYMRALLESGQATQRELLELVAEARARVSGPATREMAAESMEEIAAA